VSWTNYSSASKRLKGQAFSLLPRSKPHFPAMMGFAIFKRQKTQNFLQAPKQAPKG
jgi:hypothetical protein